MRQITEGAGVVLFCIAVIIAVPVGVVVALLNHLRGRA